MLAEITAVDTSSETDDASANRTASNSSNEVVKSTPGETEESTSTKTTDGATGETETMAIGDTEGSTPDETSGVATDENMGSAPDENAGSTGKSIIDLNSFSLDENIMIIDGQIIIKNLKIVDIKKTDTESNGLIAAKNKSSWCIFIKCSIKEAPVISRITKEDKYKIFLEKVSTE